MKLKELKQIRRVLYSAELHLKNEEIVMSQIADDLNKVLKIIKKEIDKECLKGD